VQYSRVQEPEIFGHVFEICPRCGHIRGGLTESATELDQILAMPHIEAASCLTRIYNYLPLLPPKAELETKAMLRKAIAAKKARSLRTWGI
jgi:hypothetical protein